MTACGLHHSMFVSADGLVYSCGFNDNGQLGHNDTKSRSLPTLVEAVAHLQFQEVACGYYHTLIRSNDYNIYAFGRNDKGQLGLVKSAALIFSLRVIPILQVLFHVKSLNLKSKMRMQKREILLKYTR